MPRSEVWLKQFSLDTPTLATTSSTSSVFLELLQTFFFDNNNKLPPQSVCDTRSKPSRWTISSSASLALEIWARCMRGGSAMQDGGKPPFSRRWATSTMRKLPSSFPYKAYHRNDDLSAFGSTHRSQPARLAFCYRAGGLLSLMKHLSYLIFYCLNKHDHCFCKNKFNGQLLTISLVYQHFDQSPIFLCG